MSSVQNLQKKCLGHPNEYLGNIFQNVSLFRLKGLLLRKKTQFSLLIYLYWFQRYRRESGANLKKADVYLQGGAGEG